MRSCRVTGQRFVGFCGVVVFVVLLAHAGVQTPHLNPTGLHNDVVGTFEFLLGTGWLVIRHVSLSVPLVFAPALAAYLTGLVFRRGLSRAIAEDFAGMAEKTNPEKNLGRIA